MTAHYDKCSRGHELTRDNAKVYRKHGRIYTQCRKCTKTQTNRPYTGGKSKAAVTQRALSNATIEREDMTECWSCPPSPLTGQRGLVVLDEDGDPYCYTCGRVQRAKVVMKL